MLHFGRAVCNRVSALMIKFSRFARNMYGVCDIVLPLALVLCSCVSSAVLVADCRHGRAPCTAMNPAGLPHLFVSRQAILASENAWLLSGVSQWSQRLYQPARYV